MRVVTVFPPDPWVSQNLTGSWRAWGAEVLEVIYPPLHEDWSVGRWDRFQAFNRELYDRITAWDRESRVELVFFMASDDVIDADMLRRLRESGLRLVNYSVDAVHMWYRLTKTASCFNRIACAQQSARRHLERHGGKFFWMPMAFAPHLFPDWIEQPIEKKEVLYLGSPWPYRQKILLELRARGIPICIRGHNWKPNSYGLVHAEDRKRKFRHDLRHYLVSRLRGDSSLMLGSIFLERLLSRRGLSKLSNLIPESVQTFAYTEMAGLCQRFALNLGFSHIQGWPGCGMVDRQMRLRDYEIIGCGGALLAEASEDLSTVADDNLRVLQWRNIDELVQLCLKYFSEIPFLERHRSKARSEVLKNHCWANRFRGLLEELALCSDAHSHPGKRTDRRGSAVF